MKMIILLPVIICLHLSPGISGETQLSGKTVFVTVQDKTFKKFRSCHLPNDLHLFIKGHHISKSLHLHRTYQERIVVPVSVMEEKKDGGHLPRLWGNFKSNAISFEDKQHSATVEITCSLTKLRFPQYSIRGFVTIANQIYSLKPVKNHKGRRYSSSVAHEIEIISHGNVHHGNIVYHKERGQYRYKRQGVPEYKIDVHVLVDFKLFNHWVDLSEGSTMAEKKSKAKSGIPRYIVLVFKGVNMRYANIPDYKVTVNIVEITIFESEADNQVTPVSPVTIVSANTTLYNLRNYVDNTDLGNIDHVMLFTGYDIVSTDSGVLFTYTTGQAFVGTMCAGGGRSVSVVEDHGGFESVHTATHELAHSMNATHDGGQNNCRQEDRYIMAGGPSDMTSENRANPWLFSPCSIREMAAFFSERIKTTDGRSCLLQALAPTGSIPDVGQQTPGQLYDPDVQCQNIYGKSSYYCRSRGFGNVSDICHSMFCHKANQRNSIECNEHNAADYTSCGNKAWCENGKCIYSQNAPSKNAECVHGDEPSRQINSKTCSNLILEGTYFCYNKVTQELCCQTCQNNTTGIEGCEYGDMQPGCHAGYCNTITPKGTVNDFACCGTCQHRPREWECRDNNNALPELVCSTVKEYQCYNMTIAFHCCKKCAGFRDIKNTGCEYGDKTSNCQQLTNYGQSCDSEIKPFCCKTCTPKETSAQYHMTSSASITLILCIASSVFIQPQTT